MGYDYALVHLYYNIPPAALLTALYWPLFTTLDVYKVVFHIIIAVVATIPWDSYLIHSNVWSYPPDAIVGPTFLKIPAEELFFFVIQTYNTSLLYLFLSKPTFHPVYLRARREDGLVVRKRWIALAVTGAIVGGAKLIRDGGQGFYMGLILVWAGPFVLLLWLLGYQFIVNLPLSNTLLPVALPTAYLWLVDTLALRRGTWVIENGTKLGWQLWDGLEIEEAVFFLATNVLIIFGLITMDNALAILYTFPKLFPSVPALPSPQRLVGALLTSTSKYDIQRLEGFRDAIGRLRRKSRSFYLASGVFQGRLRHDLILLYSFCRVADDLVDNATDPDDARKAIQLLRRYLDLSYHKDSAEKSSTKLHTLLKTVPESSRLALQFLPTAYISQEPLYELLDGFEMDLQFSSDASPICDEAVLAKYGERVAGTVAELIIELAYHHSTVSVGQQTRSEVLKAGRVMGVALQVVNIARDVAVDVAIGRVYIPSTWLKDAGVEAKDIIKNPQGPLVEALRGRLLDYAMSLYRQAMPKIEELPPEARRPMRVAVESYMEIGRVLRQPGYRVKAGRATVPKFRRIRVAWKALCT